MSKGPENTFIGSVHRHLPVDLYRMKNHNQYNGGIADCWYSGRAGDLWVEYKFIVPPKRESTLVDLCSGKNPELSALQQQWLRARHDEGRRVAVIVGCKDGGVIYEQCDWECPRSTESFKRKILTRQNVALWIAERTHG